MADEQNEDDTWLYGSSNNAEQDESKDEALDSQKASDSDTNLQTEENTDAEQHDSSLNGDIDTTDNNADASETKDETNLEQPEENIGNSKDNNCNEDGNDDDDDDSDDDVVVTIGDIKSGSSYNIKQRGNLLQAGIVATQDKPKVNMGKFSIEEFESVGTISGQTAIEYNIEAIEDKPWRKPGADITDYFNYGFNEETWRAYCERQKKMRLHESGVGLIGLGSNAPPPSQANNSAPNRTLTSLTADNSKYSGSGTSGLNSSLLHVSQNRQGFDNSSGRNDNTTKENVIQVMTAERREYSRPKGKFDVTMSMPPPPFNVVNEPFYPEDTFSYGFEPTQEQQWNSDNVGWVPSGIKELTPGPQMVPPPHINMNMPPPNAMMPPQMMNVPQMVPPPPPQHMGMIPPQIPPPMMMPPHMMGRDRNDRDREDRNNMGDFRDHDDKRNAQWRPRDKERDYRDRSRERERDRDRGKSEESERPSRSRDDDSPARDRDRRRERDRYRDRDRDRGSRRERSRSRERSERRRRSKSRESTRDKDRKSRDKKKSTKKEKDDSE